MAAEVSLGVAVAAAERGEVSAVRPVGGSAAQPQRRARRRLGAPSRQGPRLERLRREQPRPGAAQRRAEVAQRVPPAPDVAARRRPQTGAEQPPGLRRSLRRGDAAGAPHQPRRGRARRRLAARPPLAVEAAPPRAWLAAALAPQPATRAAHTLCPPAARRQPQAAPGWTQARRKAEHPRRPCSIAERRDRSRGKERGTEDSVALLSSEQKKESALKCCCSCTGRRESRRRAPR